MTILIALALLQSPPAHEPIDDHIAAFLKGDSAARSELAKLGAFAIRPLRSARDKNPGKVDALILELKKAAAHPKDTVVVEMLGAKVRFVQEWELQGWNLADIREKSHLQVFLDSSAQGDVKPAKAAIKVEDGPAHAVFDQIFAQTGLDYGIFHNVVVIGKPERLWPPGPPAQGRALKAEEVARARELVEQLDDETIETREAATRDLLKLGPGVVAVLEACLGRKEPEIVARCQSMIESLRRIPRGAYGPPAAERQKLSGEDDSIFNLMKIKTYPKIRLREVPLSGFADILLGSKDVPFRFEGKSGGGALSLDSEGMTLMDLWCLMTQSIGADFVIREGTVVIDFRDNIEKLLSEKK